MRQVRFDWGKFRHKDEIVVCLILRSGPGWYRIAPANGSHMRITMSDGWVRMLPGPTDREVDTYVRARWPDEADTILAKMAKESTAA